MNSKEPKWLEWAKKLQAVAQAGLTYSKNKHDLEKFQLIREISIDILQNYTEIDNTKIRNLFVNETGYQTPKIDVRAAIFKCDKILMIREKNDGLWALPGGWADIDTSLKEIIIKEVKEEAGVDIKVKRVIAILDRRKYNVPPMPYGVYKIFVECDFVGGHFEKNIETSESNFFTLENLPPLSTGRNTKEQIKMCFNARKKKVHEALFD